MEVQLLILASHVLLVAAMGFYLITNLQWYGYKPERVVFHHKKPHWHLIHLGVPFVLYYLTGGYFWIYFYFAYLPALWLWNRRLDKPLAVTGRVKRYFALLIGAVLFQDLLCLAKGVCELYGIFLPLFMAVLFSTLLEKYLMALYKRQAQKKLASMEHLTIVAITASFGKTSIKNYLRQLLEGETQVYATPRSVNTDKGIIADINQSLPATAKVYVVEAGARLPGDIAVITALVEPHYAIVGKVGGQHLEYFKTVDNVRATKLELLRSPRLKKGFVHESTEVSGEHLTVFGDTGDAVVADVEATLEGTKWTIREGEKATTLFAPVLGAFNAQNITAAFLAARELGVSEETLVRKVAALEPVQHRLQKMPVSGKLIIDDSFNGNLEGMLEAVRLASTYEGRKVIVTPGIVESDEESNVKLAEAINEVFDLALITGTVNADLLAHHIDHGKRKRVFDKRGLEKFLELETRSGDLILFANDTPAYL